MVKPSPFLFCSHNQISSLNLCLLSRMVENGESQNEKQSKIRDKSTKSVGWEPVSAIHPRSGAHLRGSPSTSFLSVAASPAFISWEHLHIHSSTYSLHCCFFWLKCHPVYLLTIQILTHKVQPKSFAWKPFLKTICHSSLFFPIQRLDCLLYQRVGTQSETNILRSCMATQSLSYNQLLIYGHLVSLSFNSNCLQYSQIVSPTHLYGVWWYTFLAT